MSATGRTQAEVINALRRLQMRQMPEGASRWRPTATCAGPRCPRSTATCCTWRIAGSCARARAAGRCARATRSSPTGSRVVWIEDLDLPDDLWARLRIPIGLAFFLRGDEAVVALYPSPVGATEAEIDDSAWAELAERNPVVASLEPDAEALILDRMGEGTRAVIAPTDQAYRLVGLVKASWEGISGGSALESAVEGFFAELRERAG